MQSIALSKEKLMPPRALPAAVKADLRRKPLISKHIRLRLITEADADFVLSTRLDAKAKYISPIAPDIAKQIDFIRASDADDHQFYFVIEDLAGKRLGLVRVYDLTEDSFSWGSWIIMDGAPMTTAIASAMMIYEFGFGVLGYDKVRFDVRKGNIKVISFHLKMGAEITHQDNQDYYFRYDEAAYLQIRPKYQRYL